MCDPEFRRMNVLCTDKTGPSLRTKIFLAQHPDALGRPSDERLEYAYSQQLYQTGLKNLWNVAAGWSMPSCSKRELRIATQFRKVDVESHSTLSPPGCQVCRADAKTGICIA